jgi:hypothetical protein
MAECTGTSTSVPLAAGASFDPDGTPVTFLWSEDCPDGFLDDPSSARPCFVLDGGDACERRCVVELRVSSGGRSSACSTTVTVADTTAPVIAGPPDLVEVRTGGPAGGQTDPARAGRASASDCDPNPAIAYSDRIETGHAPGEPEIVVTRTWTATDACMNQSSCVQTITLLSPSQGLFAKLDLLPGSFPNLVPAKASPGVLSLVLLGTSGFDVTLVDRPTLRLRRADNAGAPIARMSLKLKDCGRPGAGSEPCECGSGAPDGRMDLQISVDAAAFSEGLALADEARGERVEVALTGRLCDGRWFAVTDCLIVR